MTFHFTLLALPFFFSLHVLLAMFGGQISYCSLDFATSSAGIGKSVIWGGIHFGARAKAKCWVEIVLFSRQTGSWQEITK